MKAMATENGATTGIAGSTLAQMSRAPVDETSRNRLKNGYVLMPDLSVRRDGGGVTNEVPRMRNERAITVLSTLMDDRVRRHHPRLLVSL
jgi:hypothetical protein